MSSVREHRPTAPDGAVSRFSGSGRSDVHVAWWAQSVAEGGRRSEEGVMLKEQENPAPGSAGAGGGVIKSEAAAAGTGATVKKEPADGLPHAGGPDLNAPSDHLDNKDQAANGIPKTECKYILLKYLLIPTTFDYAFQMRHPRIAFMLMGIYCLFKRWWIIFYSKVEK